MTEYGANGTTTHNAPEPGANDSSRVDPALRDEVPPAWTDEARGWRRGKVRFRDATRPWNWMELDADEADKLWGLLVKFVAFVNRRYADRSTRRIPPCWAEHGALVEELTTLWWARWQAFESPHASIGGAQYWHSYTLPGFFERTARWLEDDLLPCQQGQHRDREDPPLTTGSGWEVRTEVIRVIDREHRRPHQGQLDVDPRSRAESDVVEVGFLDKKPQ